MGISVDLIVPECRDLIAAEILPNFMCAICHALMEDAIALKCQHSFCRACLSEWILKQSEENHIPCPACRTIFNPANGIENSRLVRAVLSAVKFKCPLAPCDVIVSYDDFTLHPKECLAARIRCSFCVEEMDRCDEKVHNTGCIGYIKFQNCELEVANLSLKTENDLLKQHLKSINRPVSKEIEILKTELQETGFKKS